MYKYHLNALKEIKECTVEEANQFLPRGWVYLDALVMNGRVRVIIGLPISDESNE